MPLAAEYLLWMERVERTHILPRSPILSLGDIVKEFDLGGYTQLMDRIHQVQNTCGQLKGRDLTDCNHFFEVAKNACKYCAAVKFIHASARAFSLMMHLEKLPWTLDYSSVQMAFKCLEEDITYDMFHQKFVQIDENKENLLNNENLLGDKVILAFPSSKQDIIEAGNCMSVDLNTAAIFHLMHVVEWGLRAFAGNLELLQVSIDKKNNRTIPVEYSDWERILNQLPEKIDKKIDLMPRGAAKQEAQEFYYSTLKEISGFKDAWRNHVMHTRASYTYEDASAVLSHVKRFMCNIAEYGILETADAGTGVVHENSEGHAGDGSIQRCIAPSDASV